MLQKIGLNFLLLFVGCSAHAQVIVHGSVFDSISSKTLSQVSIENQTTHQGAISDAYGQFQLEAKMGDLLVFTYVGYERKTIECTNWKQFEKLRVGMLPKTTFLKPVTILKGLTEYQKDSASRADLYKGIFQYEQSKSAFTPITSIYQKFSKKHKNLRKHQGQILTIEQEKFIDTRYTPDLVHALTKLQGDELASFMNQYPMAYDYSRVASELEIKMWIKYNFQDYIKKGRPTFSTEHLKKRKDEDD